FDWARRGQARLLSAFALAEHDSDPAAILLGFGQAKTERNLLATTVAALGAPYKRRRRRAIARPVLDLPAQADRPLCELDLRVVAGEVGLVLADPQLDVVVVEPARATGDEGLITHRDHEIADRDHEHAELGAARPGLAEDDETALARLVEDGRAT